MTTEGQNPHSSGYWEGKSWHSFLHNQDQFDNIPRIGECLRDKQVFFIGDSTLHQIWMELCPILNVPIALEYMKCDDAAELQSKPTSIYLNDYNLTINFVFHHIRVGLPRYFSCAVFEVDVLDSLGQESCDHVVVLGFGIHFRQWSRSAFIDRVTHINSAVSRLRKRCPHTLIIVKGPHMASENNKYRSWSDWFVYEMKEIMKLHFQHNGILFLDTWDMNLSFLAPNNVHMPPAPVRQEFRLLLSMLCS